MNELQALKRKLEEQLDAVNKVIQIQSEWNESDKNGEVKPIIIDSDDIEKLILTIEGEFSANDVPAAIRGKFKQKPEYKDSSIAVALYRLVTIGKLEYVRERAGRRPAIYRVKQKR